MIKQKLTLGIAVLAAAAAFGLRADPVELSPIAISATPGGSFGWGFTVQSDPSYYISISSSFVLSESSPGMGFFTDWIGLAGGPTNGFLAPGAPAWQQSYDPLLGTGFGEYLVDPLATPGTSNIGEFLVAWLRFSGDPTSCGSCFVDVLSTTVAFRVDVAQPQAAAVPEPSMLVSILTGGVLLTGMGTVRKRRASVSATR